MKVYALTLLFLSVNFSHGKNNDTLNTSFQNEIYSNYTKKLTEIPPLLGTLNFGYKRYIKNKFGIIMNITFSQINGSYKNKFNDTLSFKTKDNIIAILPGFEYHYFS